MVPVLPDMQGLFIQIQKSLYNLGSNHVTLSEVVHQYLHHFRWLHYTPFSLPNRLYNIDPSFQPYMVTTTPPDT